MNEQKICAVIVTFHPSPKMLMSIPEVMKQVHGLVVVDNGSNPPALDPLRILTKQAGFHLIENGQNLGIAEALNRGARWAIDTGYPWVILFDQDSNLTAGFVDSMFETLWSHPQRDRIGSLHPTYVDQKTGKEANVLRAEDGGPIKSMTSGSLLPAWIFDRVGWFASEYFIDEVDSEFCYRIRAAGYLVADSRKAILLHQVGRPEPFSIFGFACLPTNHNPLRRYYMSRNRVVLYRKYFRVFPRWVLLSMYETFRETIKCFIAERQRIKKIRNFFWGTWDGMTGNMGKREGIE